MHCYSWVIAEMPKIIFTSDFITPVYMLISSYGTALKGTSDELQ